MNKISKFVALATFVGASALMAQPASAASVLIGGSGQTLSSANDFIAFGEKNLQPGTTYDFTFTTVESPLSTQEQIQASILGIAQDVGFKLYNGTPGSGTLVTASAISTAAVVLYTLTAGPHFIEIDTVLPAQKGETLSGAVFITPSAAPEPATWLSMIFGFGMLGGLMRFARRATPATAA